jgi:hypothetical protein
MENRAYPSETLDVVAPLTPWWLDKNQKFVPKIPEQMHSG